MIVVKYGGNAMSAALAGDPLLEELSALHRGGEQIVLVHGGGPEIDAALAERGIETTRVEGQRVTDAATLSVTEAVLCGTINKRIVRALQSLGVNAAGLSGQDAQTLVARRLRGNAGEDLGYVGEIATVDTKLIETLLAANLLPVIAPLAIEETLANALNVNADAAAGAIATVLQARALILATNVARVLRDPDDPSSGIDRLTPGEATQFAKSDACRSSMKPKLLAATNAARANVPSYICSTKANAISLAFRGEATLVV
ncbi:MAG TPA: acetylglutamate kinase [Candidatus Cybelea sp.]|nr:acetylglutamate kinase [Candidatus Cybelea sp.]